MMRYFSAMNIYYQKMVRSSTFTVFKKRSNAQNTQNKTATIVE